MATSLSLLDELLQCIEATMSEKKEMDWSEYHLITRRVTKTGEMRAMDLAIEAIKFIIDKDDRKVLHIADLGCGDASIMKYFYSKSELKEYNQDNRIMTEYKQCKIQIDSFDLYRKQEHYVFNVDFSDLKPFGIKDGFYDIIICCLSLQSKNEKKLREIERVCVKNNGYLLIWQPKRSQDEILEIIEEKTNFCIEDIKQLERFKTSKKCSLQNCCTGYSQIFCGLHL